jgi:hypothetical protein
MDFKKLKNREINGGIQYVAVFENGYGASIVQHSFSYGAKQNKWELAVINNIQGNPFDDDFGFDLCYSTHITDDVMGHLLEEEVNDILVKIKQIKTK